MRLTCPNCKAQYEIDGSAIPDTGRDVQCSACATTWYQYPEGQDPAPPLPADADHDTGAPNGTPAGTGAGPAPQPDTRTPRIDQSVLDVLREEAARELTERRRNNTSGLETQGDLGLVTRPRPSGTTQRPETADPLPGEADAGADTPGPAPSRRNLLPDIEELSSTLQPGNAPRRTGGAESTLPAAAPDDRAGFRQGLSLVLLVAVLLVGLYALAPMIARNIPALAEPLAGYVALVDSLRASVSETLRGLIARLSASG